MRPYGAHRFSPYHECSIFVSQNAGLTESGNRYPRGSPAASQAQQVQPSLHWVVPLHGSVWNAIRRRRPCVCARAHSLQLPAAARFAFM